MSESVKVAVRCRPMSEKELLQKCRCVMTVDSASRSCCLLDGSWAGQQQQQNGGKVYQFDAAFGPETSTEMVYEEVGSYVVEAVLDGYNGTVFAYGQTGCGKSHTMRGFVERALEHLFDATSTASSDTRYLALLTYLEIYNEKLRDLLQANDSGNENLLQLKEDPVKGTYVAGGLREVTVKDARECARLVDQGDRRRAAAATKMNAASSRSHAVLTLSLEAIAMGPGAPAGGAVRRGRLHLVDLAGSERQGRTGATGDRLKEAASINLSLSALGNVISALAAGNGRHVPYRDSKLTRLLRDSLGGNARTLMIACVSPSDADADETLSTLRYAARARCIKNKPIVNEDPKDALLRQYQLELQRLRKLLESGGESKLDNRVGGEEEAGAQRQQDPEREVESRAADVLVLEEGSTGSSPSPTTTVSPTTEANTVTAVAAIEPERRRKKREAAKQEVLRRLERLTIGGEAQDDTEIRRRRERRRKRLQALAEALDKSSREGNAGAFEVYGQLKCTEDALKRMAKRTKQLEAEAADLQASWDEERRDLLRRELLIQQICEAMIPHLRPGCPLRDVSWVRSNSSWSSELGRWRLPDFSSSSVRIPLPPALSLQPSSPPTKQPDLNNNSNGLSLHQSDARSSPEDEANSPTSPSNEGARMANIVDEYFRRGRVDKILAHAREAKTFEPAMVVSTAASSTTSSNKSGSIEDSSQQPQLTPIQANGAPAPPHNHPARPSSQMQYESSSSYQQKSLPTPPSIPSLPSAWTNQSVTGAAGNKLLLPPAPRLLEALPASYPHARLQHGPIT